MLPDSPKELVPRFFDDTSETYDRVVNWATFGKDRYWKKEITDKIQDATSILDVACGTGILTRQISTKFPHAKVIGLDITKNYLKIAEKKSSTFSNISFVCQDAEKLDIDKKFDCICSSYVPKYCKPKVLVKNCMAHLNPGGKIILHDFTYPKNKVICSLWNLYFGLLRLIGVFLPSWKDAFIHLPKLIKKSAWVKEYTQELEKNGFKVIRQNLTLHSSTILLATK